MEINGFEVDGKAVRHTLETIEDAGMALNACVLDTLFNQGLSGNHSRKILDQAEEALSNNDRKEATHQLNRGRQFSNLMMPPGNRYGIAAQAGLESIERGDIDPLVAWKMDSAFLNLNDSPINKGHEIPSYARYRQGFGGLVEETARFHCTRILGIEVPAMVELGDKDSAETYLKRSQYLASKYIPGNTDEYEMASWSALNMLKRGEPSAHIIRELEPFINRVKQTKSK